MNGSRYWNDVAASFQARASPDETVLRPPDGLFDHSITSWSGSAYGSGASRVACTTLKIAVFGPMPSASAAMAARENPGAFITSRRANRRSDHSTVMSLLRRAQGVVASTRPKNPLNPYEFLPSRASDNGEMFDLGMGKSEVEQRTSIVDSDY